MCTKWITVILSVLLFSCSEEEGDSGYRIFSDGEKGKYRGGVRKAWININSSNITPDEVSWRLGKASIWERSSIVNDEGVYTSDTLFFHWDKAPLPKIDTIITITDVDTLTTITEVYSDTIFAIIDGSTSDALDFEIKNVLPKIDTITLGTRVIPQEDYQIKLSGNRGEKVKFSLKISDAFNTDFEPDFSWPDSIAIQKLNIDTANIFVWSVPDTIFNQSFIFSVKDKSGFGSRDYNMSLLSYNQTGSAWIAASNQLVKITANGEEVMRIYGNYKEISDIAIDPNSTDFWVADKGSHTLFHYNQDGELLLADSGRFIQPTALAIDVESGFLWVADLPSGAKGRMRRYLEGPDSLSLTASDTGYSGPISDLSMDQFKNDLLWFSVPEADEIGLIRNGKLDTLFGSGLPFNRPKHISWDTQGGKVWIADSSSVYLSDTTGIIQATITGFSFISGISSGQSGVCIADARNGEVYQFKATITGNLTKSVGVLSSGFLSPEDVSVVHEDGSCWFVDSEMGVAIRLSSSGEEMYRLYGFKQPTVISVHQGVE